MKKFRDNGRMPGDFSGLHFCGREFGPNRVGDRLLVMGAIGD